MELNSNYMQKPKGGRWLARNDMAGSLLAIFQLQSMLKISKRSPKTNLPVSTKPDAKTRDLLEESSRGFQFLGNGGAATSQL